MLMERQKSTRGGRFTGIRTRSVKGPDISGISATFMNQISSLL